ncbi:MAG TPA: sulfurtransferase [Anaeromyxobacteraceae bacterium]|nr:sulfurtransferase [Anaeromyxobacteraceae bacterium]
MAFGPLVSPEALRSLAAPVRLLDARPGDGPYAAGHLAGALHADLDLELSGAGSPGFDPARGGRHPLPALREWAAQLGAWGIGPDTLVVAYDEAGGGIAAARLWWMLRAVGHEHVAVLDGGLPAARVAGLAVTTELPPPVTARPPYPVAGWRRPLVDLEAVARLVRDPSWKVLDARSRERWRGEVETLDPVPGRIPGTVNVPYTENLGPDGRFKPPAALRSMYLEVLGGTPPERVAVHCGSGVTACHALLALELAGLPGASLYVGSYSEWCRSGRPLGRG